MASFHWLLHCVIFHSGSYARTILNYLPPASVDPLRTTIYSTEYFDDSYGFGRQFYSLVQKSGTATLPISVYFGANNFIGGFAGSSYGVNWFLVIFIFFNNA